MRTEARCKQNYAVKGKIKPVKMLPVFCRFVRTLTESPLNARRLWRSMSLLTLHHTVGDST